MNQKMKMPIHRFAVEFARNGAANQEARRIPVTWYAGATVQRIGWDGPYKLTLGMDPAQVRMDRLNSGAPVLDTHADWSIGDVIGVVEKAWLDGSSGKADIRFSQRDKVTPIWQDILDGIIKNASVGVALHKLKETTAEGEKIKSFLATDWEPMEISLVPIGADPNAGFQASGEQKFTEAEIENERPSGHLGRHDMENNEKEKLAADIRQRVKIAGLPAPFAADLIAQGLGIHESCAAIIDRLAEESQKQPPTRNANVESVDRRDGLAEHMAEALACRYLGTVPSDGAREFVGARISDLARATLLANGQRVSTYSSERLIRLAIASTSDFPNLLQSTGERILLAGYQAAQGAIKRVARQSTFSDFRTKAALRLGEAPKLLKVNEAGEITYGARGESKESYRGYTYARIFSLTRDALLADDLGAFNDFARAWGQAAASLEAQALVDLLASNPTMGDVLPLFDAAHGNLASPGAAISDTTLSAARLALRTAKGLDNETIIETAPRYLLVPAALETTAEKYLATLYPAQASNVNPFSGKLELLVEPRLDDKSTTRWYLFGDPASAPVLEFAYLADAAGPQVQTRAGWEVLGMEFRCVLDYGAGCVGWRGAYSNPGA